MSTQVAIRPEESPFPIRSSLGTLGRRMRIETNFFELQLPTMPTLYQVDVKFSEAKLPLQKRHEALAQMRVTNPNLKIYYDGTSIGATNTKFEGGAEMMTTNVILPSAGQTGKPITVTLKIVATIQYTELATFLAGKQEEIPKEYIKLLNMYLFHFAVTNPGLATFPKSSSFFMLDGERSKLPELLELLFGGFMSVRWSGVDLKMKPLHKIFLNVDTVATAFYARGPLLDRLKLLLPKASPQQKLSPQDINILRRGLKNMKIQVTHRGSHSKVYTILNISEKSSAETSFEVDGKKRTVVQHFNIAYKIQLKFPKLPCVVVAGGPTGNMELPFEICEIPNDVRFKGRLTGAQTAQIIKRTAAKPNERKAKILDLVKTISAEQIKDNPWGLNLSDKMAVVDARVLPEPEILYGGSVSANPRQGAWNISGKFFKPANLDHWAMLDFANDKRAATGFISDFVQGAKDKGMSVSATPTLLPCNPHGDLMQTVSKALAATPKCQMIMFILPLVNGQLYSDLKRIVDCDLGVPSQCLIYTKLCPANYSYLANVALKVNIKLSGINHKLKHTLPMFDRATMVVGADVTHPGGGSNAPSIAAVVGSVTADANFYVAKVDFQQSRQEYIENFEDMFLHCLRMFRLRTNALPERIMYYRDGVGEGMFKEVKRREIASMLKAFDRIEKPYPPNTRTSQYRPAITMVVVQKRHHARFFPNAQDMDRSMNCPAGTVVESGIGHPRELDFYLQSQAGLQGTSRPTHYHVLHDENKFTPDLLQDLTNRMCYLQGRCTRSVRIVTAVYHADIVCYRARCHLINSEAWSQSSSGQGSLKLEDMAKKVSSKLEKMGR